MMGAMGSFDVLPDSIACLILSKLESAQMVAQCAMVCHRWKTLARLVDTLTFESFKLLEKKLDKNRNASCLETIVTQMLLKTHGIRILKISYHPVVWPWIPNDYFSEDRTLVELAPILEDLKLNSCKGLRTPHFTALKLTSLEFANDMDVATTPITMVTVNAPSLVSVSLSHVEELVMNGFTLQNLALLWHVRPNIRELPVLESLHISGESWALDCVTHLIRLGTNLRSLRIDAFFERKYPIQLQSLLRHLQELVSIHIGADFFECLQTAGGAGAAFMRMHAMVLPRLENIMVVISCGNNNCISVLVSLLKCAPALRILRIDAENLRKSMDNVMFFSNLLGLQRDYPQVKVSLACPQTLL
ncbi:uncharacterized protein [Physcomitrium patens]|uniref:F-box domain-containing protein n=1 Tax=Physcomitrium patens TaxID=3218 RepID=A0A7I4DXT7_PHYPA|nr:uncharacterized protein LOC112283082 isoform X2 [Physcomitrium patens]|eukprot:XP_024377143.1 uncharacterized protein LOC112283082 isoform X2 [Physcomitrella patens]